MKIKYALLWLVLLTLFSSTAFAKKYWISLGSNWAVYFDNGETYIDSPGLDANCNYKRAALSSTYGDATYQKNMYAYVLAAYTMKKSINIVLDDTEDKSLGQSVYCHFYGANDN